MASCRHEPDRQEKRMDRHRRGGGDPHGDDGGAAIPRPVRLPAQYLDGPGRRDHQPRPRDRAVRVGAVQPVAGAVADRYGPGKVLVAGLVVLSFGTALTPFMTSGLGLIVSLGLLSAIGSGAGSFSVLIGAAAKRLPPESRGNAAGVINAGGSFGQFVFAPLCQKLIQGLGWMGAMWTLAVITLAALPLVRVVTPKVAPPPRPAG